MKLEDLSCRRRVTMLLEYLDRELPARERRLLARHRASCRSCGDLLKTLEHAVRTLRALKRASKPPASARRALAASLRLL